LYTSVPFAKYLLENKMTLVGTLKLNRRGIPAELKDTTCRPVGDYKILYEVGGKLSLHSWVVKPKKSKLSSVKAVFRIRIHFVLIRRVNFFPDPDPYQTFYLIS
jgi:hypothetical protein